MKNIEKDIVLQLGIRGRYKFEISKDGVNKRTVAEFDNLITNNGLNAICAGNNFAATVCVGTGTAPPTTTDNGLGNPVARQTQTSVTRNSTGSPNYTVRTIYTFNYAQGAAAGNLTEVGTGDASTGNQIIAMSRALILDGLGNPTTLTVLADEFLTITYTLLLQPVLTDVTNTVGPYTLTIRPANITTIGIGLNGWAADNIASGARAGFLHSGALGPITGTPGGSTISATTLTKSAYVTGTFTVNYTFSWNPATGALAVTAMHLQLNNQCYQIGISPTINKTTSQSVTINFRMVAARL